MSKIKFIDSLNEYVNNRANKIRDKQSEIQDLQIQLHEKKEEIKRMEEEYKLNFDDKILKKLTSMKSEVNAINNDIKNISEIIDLMDASGAFQYDDEVLSKEINDYVAGFNIPALRTNIVNAKTAYLKALEEHTNTMELLSSTRDEFEQLRDSISKENQTTIHKAFNKSANTDNSLYYDFDNLGIDERIISMTERQNHNYAINIYKDFKKEV